jgi:hypothetical protein
VGSKIISEGHTERQAGVLESRLKSRLFNKKFHCRAHKSAPLVLTPDHNTERRAYFLCTSSVQVLRHLRFAQRWKCQAGLMARVCNFIQTFWRNILYSTLRMEAVISSETLVSIYESTRRYNQEDKEIIFVMSTSADADAEIWKELLHGSWYLSTRFVH